MAEPETIAEPEPEPEPVAVAESAAEPEPQPEPEPVAVAESAAEPEPEPQPEPAIAIGQMEPVQMEPVEASGAAEEPVMWLGGPRDAADETEVAADETEVATAASHPEEIPVARSWDPLEPTAWPASDRGAATAQAVAPPLAMTEAELAQLARDEGWDDAEVAAIRAMISTPAAGAVDLPGSAELDEAMSALQAVPIGPSTVARSGREWTKPATPDEEISSYSDWAFEVEPPRAQVPAVQSPLATRRPASDPNWLRSRRGPAASAYRRIRRIFTG
jgi:hypothetical protein